MLTAYHSCATFFGMAKLLRAVRIKERDLQELARIAKKEDETISSLIQRAVREFLDRRTARANKAA